MTPKARQRQKKRQIMLRVQKHHMLLVFGCLVILVGLVAANIITEDRQFSETENRVLTTRPKITAGSLISGDFMKDYENYVADQFVWRDRWINMKLRIELLLGKTESNGVYIGKDDYLIETLSDPDVESVERNLNAINDFAKRHPELSVHSVFVPNSACINASKLPNNAPVRSQVEDLGWISSMLTPEAGFVNMLRVLEPHSSEQLYYRTDHHWTSLAAYYAYQALREPLGIGNAVIYQPYTVTNEFQGTLISKSGVNNIYDSIEIYEPLDVENNYVVSYADTQEKTSTIFNSQALLEKDKYTVFLGGNHSMITIDTENQNERCILIFKDSYANALIQFLTPFYEKIILIDPRYYYDDVELVIRNNTITDVMFLYNVNTFMTDHSLADVLEVVENEFDSQPLPESTEDEGETGETLSEGEQTSGESEE